MNQSYSTAVPKSCPGTTEYKFMQRLKLPLYKSLMWHFSIT